MLFRDTASKCRPKCSNLIINSSAPPYYFFKEQRLYRRGEISETGWRKWNKKQKRKQVDKKSNWLVVFAFYFGGNKALFSGTKSPKNTRSERTCPGAETRTWKSVSQDLERADFSRSMWWTVLNNYICNIRCYVFEKTSEIIRIINFCGLS